MEWRQSISSVAFEFWRLARLARGWRRPKKKRGLCDAFSVLTSGFLFGHLGGYITLVGLAGLRAMLAAPSPPFAEHKYFVLVPCPLLPLRKSRGATVKFLMKRIPLKA